MSRIELQQVDKFYGSNHVLKNLSLVIEDGDFMTLLEQSGCGKTTTLRIIAGLEKAQKGRLTINGNTMFDCESGFFQEPSKRKLGLVFQSYALWPHMTVFDNVAFGLKIKKLNKSIIEEKVMQSLERMRISEYVKRYPNELSGGQQQRVAIARAIASDPELLLLDEPLSNLDARLRIDMRAELKRLHREMGTTIIYVTHDQVEALTMSTKIALFSDGVLTQIGSPMDLYMNPVTLSAADFIGNPRINFLNGKAYWDGRSLVTNCGLGEYRFGMEHMITDELQVGEFDCVFGIRPEQILISEFEEEDSVPVSVYASQPAGSETLITLVKGEHEFLAKQIGLSNYDINQKVYIKFDQNKFNVYHKNEGRLIKFAL